MNPNWKIKNESDLSNQLLGLKKYFEDQKICPDEAMSIAGTFVVTLAILLKINEPDLIQFISLCNKYGESNGN